MSNATNPPHNDWQKPMKSIGKNGVPVPQEELRMSRQELMRVVRAAQEQTEQNG